MIGSEKQMVNVALLREDVERIKKLQIPISEFCCNAVSERLRIIEIAKENTIEERFFEDADPATDTAHKIIIHDDPIMEPTKNWSKLFAEV